MMAAMRAEDELVAVFDADGRVTGAAPRGVVYRDGIWHGGTGVLVRSGDGERVYLHRRAPDKLHLAGPLRLLGGRGDRSRRGPGAAPRSGSWPRSWASPGCR